LVALSQGVWGAAVVWGVLRRGWGEQGLGRWYQMGKKTRGALEAKGEERGDALGLIGDFGQKALANAEPSITQMARPDKQRNPITGAGVLEGVRGVDVAQRRMVWGRRAAVDRDGKGVTRPAAAERSAVACAPRQQPKK